MSAPVTEASTGALFQGRPRQLTWARALALSGGPFNAPGWPEKNLHTNLEAANAAGLAEVVVSGTQWEGYLVGLMVELFGSEWFGGGTLDIKIPRSVKIGELIQPKARLQGRTRESDHVRIDLDVWCENEAGQQVLVGTASCAVRAQVAEPLVP